MLRLRPWELPTREVADSCCCKLCQSGSLSGLSITLTFSASYWQKRKSHPRPVPTNFVIRETMFQYWSLLRNPGRGSMPARKSSTNISSNPSINAKTTIHQPDLRKASNSCVISNARSMSLILLSKTGLMGRGRPLKKWGLFLR